MVLVDVLVGGAEGVGEGIQGLEGQEVLNGVLGCRDDAQSLGEVQIVLGWSVTVCHRESEVTNLDRCQQ